MLLVMTKTLVLALLLTCRTSSFFFPHILSYVTRSSRCPRSCRARVSVSLKKRKKKENFLQVIWPSSELSPYFNTTLYLTV